jgi:glycosyltransferase involved in cell wall biosynthesis
VATAARLSAGKGVKTFLRAAAIVAGRHPTASFVVLGGGELEGPLQALARDLGIAERVVFAGWRDDVTRSLRGCEVFVHASRLGEGLPNAVLEAMMAGLPVVATDVGGTREAVVEGETGFLVGARDVPALAERVSRLLEDPELARRLGARGLEVAREKFSIEAMVARTEALYRSVLRGSGSPV